MLGSTHAMGSWCVGLAVAPSLGMTTLPAVLMFAVTALRCLTRQPGPLPLHVLPLPQPVTPLASSMPAVVEPYSLRISVLAFPPANPGLLDVLLDGTRDQMVGVYATTMGAGRPVQTRLILIVTLVVQCHSWRNWPHQNLVGYAMRVGQAAFNAPPAVAILIDVPLPQPALSVRLRHPVQTGQDVFPQRWPLLKGVRGLVSSPTTTTQLTNSIGYRYATINTIAHAFDSTGTRRQSVRI
jgi:hypothetical protein